MKQISQDKQLYCVAFTYRKVTKRGKRKWVARFEYCHAANQGEARLNFTRGLPPHARVGDNIEIQGIAPVVGVFEEEQKVTTGIRFDNIRSV